MSSVKWALNENPVSSTKLNNLCVTNWVNQAAIDTTQVIVGSIVYLQDKKQCYRVKTLSPLTLAPLSDPNPYWMNAKRILGSALTDDMITPQLWVMGGVQLANNQSVAMGDMGLSGGAGSVSTRVWDTNIGDTHQLDTGATINIIRSLRILAQTPNTGAAPFLAAVSVDLKKNLVLKQFIYFQYVLNQSDTNQHVNLYAANDLGAITADETYSANSAYFGIRAIAAATWTLYSRNRAAITNSTTTGMPAVDTAAHRALLVRDGTNVTCYFDDVQKAQVVDNLDSSFSLARVYIFNTAAASKTIKLAEIMLGYVMNL